MAKITPFIESDTKRLEKFLQRSNTELKWTFRRPTWVVCDRFRFACVENLSDSEWLELAYDMSGAFSKRR